MKKFLSVSFLIVFLCSFCFAQKSANAANHNTALRCLKLAENCLMSGDWNNALKQAELGLSYDDSISDLIYVKAASLSNLGDSKAQVLPVIEEAFEKDSWAGYSKNGARLFIADLLCDTGDYAKSLMYLDAEPFIYSADAEFIRIKNYYRMGTKDSYEQARLKINSARRIYPNDVRFPNIFFLFEQLYLAIDTIFNNENISETDPLVQTIADSYITKLPDYQDKNLEMELLAAFFAKDEAQVRLVKSIYAKNKETHPLMAVLGLKTGLFTEEEAFDYFVKACNGNIPLITFEFFMQQLNTEDSWNKILEYFTNFEGSFFVDTNYDLQIELVVDYEVGRPRYISFDANNDGEKELYCVCDFGVPKTVFLMNNAIEYSYEKYPEVYKVKYAEDNSVLTYLYGDYIYYPFELAKEPFLEIMGLEFFVPVAASLSYPDMNDIYKASTIELPGVERDNSRVVYALDQGLPVNAKFYENDVQYAYCDFQTGIPFVRYADYDNDGFYETSETFDMYEIGQNFSDDDTLIIQSVFGLFPEDSRLYLRKVAIDRNGNTYPEYYEEYLENGGRISTWDNDDNGVIDYQHIVYSKTGDTVNTETVFYSDNGLEYIRLSLIDDIPVSMKKAGDEVVIFAGETENYYWIEKKGSVDIEKLLSETINGGLEQGSIEIFNCLNERVSVIKIDSMYFCRVLPESLVTEEVED